MFVLIRLTIGIIIFLILNFLIKKSKSTYKQILRWGSFAVIIIVTSILFLIPFEGTLLSFSSPESAYRYFTGQFNIDLVINGENSDMVFGGNTALIIPKTEAGWRVESGITAKAIIKKIPTMLRSTCIIIKTAMIITSVFMIGAATLPR